MLNRGVAGMTAALGAFAAQKFGGGGGNAPSPRHSNADREAVMTTTRHHRNTSPARRPAAALTRRLRAIPLLLAALSLLAVLFVGAPSAQAQQGHPAPQNVQVVPGDGTLTVTWDVSPRDGFDDHQIRHALRWSQEAGVWANPADPEAGGREDGVPVDGGVYSYTITGLENGVATGVFVRSFTGGSLSERSPHSSPWVRIKGGQHHAHSACAPAADAARTAGAATAADPHGGVCAEFVFHQRSRHQPVEQRRHGDGEHLAGAHPGEQRHGECDFRLFRGLYRRLHPHRADFGPDGHVAVGDWGVFGDAVAAGERGERDLHGDRRGGRDHGWQD